MTVLATDAAAPRARVESSVRKRDGVVPAAVVAGRAGELLEVVELAVAESRLIADHSTKMRRKPRLGRCRCCATTTPRSRRSRQERTVERVRSVRLFTPRHVTLSFGSVLSECRPVVRFGG